MYLDYYCGPVEVVPTVWSATAPYDPKQKKRELEKLQNNFVSGQGSVVGIFDVDHAAARFQTPDPIRPQLASDANSTPLGAKTTKAVETAPAPVVEASSRSDVNWIASQRIRMLAAKYAGHANSEVLARLEILSQRMLEHSPPVSPDQMESLEKSRALLSNIQQSRLERAERRKSRIAA